MYFLVHRKEKKNSHTQEQEQEQENPELQKFGQVKLKKMDALRERAARDLIENEMDEMRVTEILGNLCEAECKSGHTENAVAIIQAAIEIGVTGNREAFDDFWCSGAARIGETEFSGFESWLVKKEITPIVLQETLDDHLDLDEAISELAAPEDDEKNDDIKVNQVRNLDGLRSIQADGTAYSLAHGYRIRIELVSHSASLKKIQARHENSIQKFKKALASWARHEIYLDENQFERIVSLKTISPFIIQKPFNDPRAWRSLLLYLLSSIGLVSTRSCLFHNLEHDDQWFKSTVTTISRKQFIRNVLVFFLMRIPHNRIWQEQLQAALLFLDTYILPHSTHWPSVRNHAKSLLKSFPKSILLWSAYSQLEAASGKPQLGKQLAKATIENLGPHPVLLWNYARHTLGLQKNSTPDHIAFLNLISELDTDSNNVSTEQTRARLDLRLRAALSSTINQEEPSYLLDDTVSVVSLVGVIAAFDLVTLGPSAAVRTIDDVHTNLQSRNKFQVSCARLVRIKNELIPPVDLHGANDINPNDFFRLVQKHPVSKSHWLLAFTQSHLCRAFKPPKLLDILNEILDRGLHIRDPRIVLIMKHAEDGVGRKKKKDNNDDPFASGDGDSKKEENKRRKLI